MEKILKKLEYRIFKKYDKGYVIDNKDIWSFNKDNKNTQLEHNNNLRTKVLDIIKNEGLDVIITSGVVCTIFDNFDDFYLIGEDDVYNYKRYKSDITEDFQPFYLIRNIEKIGIVIKADIKINDNHIIITDTQGSKIKIIEIVNLPSIKLIDCFK